MNGKSLAEHGLQLLGKTQARASLGTDLVGVTPARLP